MGKGKVPGLDKNKPDANWVPQIDKHVKHAGYVCFSCQADLTHARI
jgi:hypothetical protein